MKLNGASLLTRGNVTFWIFETFRFRSTNGIGLGGNIQRERERERVCIWKRRERVTRVKVLVNYETLLPRSGVENCGPLRRGRDASRGNFRWKTTEFHEIREIRGEKFQSVSSWLLPLSATIDLRRRRISFFFFLYSNREYFEYFSLFIFITLCGAFIYQYIITL